MGECGCEAEKIARVAAGEGRWLVLEVHPGRTYCGTEWGLGLTEVREDSEEWDWWFKDVPVAEFSRYGTWGTLLLDTEILKKRFMEDGGYTDGLDETPFAVAEFVDRGGLREVFWRTRDKAKKQEAEYRARVAGAAPTPTESPR